MGWGQILGSAAGGFFGGPLGAGLGAGLGGFIDQEQANNYNSAEAASNRNFQQSMSSTSYQRAMADMKAAGLNPMLAFSQGGANVPTGSSASWSNVVDSSGSSAAALMSADAARVGSEASSVSANAAALQASTSAKLAEASVSRIKQEIINLKTDNEKADSIIRNLAIEASNLLKQGKNLDETRNQIRATVTKLYQDADLTFTQNLNQQVVTKINELELKGAPVSKILQPIVNIFKAFRGK